MSTSLEPRQKRRGQQEVAKNTPTKTNYVIIGGGIAGVCCAQECARLSPPDLEIILITASEMLKEVRQKLPCYLSHLLLNAYLF